MKKILAIFVLTVCFSSNVFAADVAGQVRSYKVGNFKFIALKDKETNMGREILLEPTSDIAAKLMPNNQNPSSINAFVVKDSNRTILIDTGTGEDGYTVDNLIVSGTNPEDVDIVIITHMHSDHIGGLVRFGRKVFPKAFIFINAKELEYWTKSLMSDERTSLAAKRVENVYGEKIKTFEWGDIIVPGIKAVAAPGHTPGHTVFEIESEGEKMLVISDLVHVLKIQMAEPNMAVIFDINPREAIASRKKIFKEVSKNKTRIAGMHIPFPGVGTIIEGTRGEYMFTPSVSIN